MRIVVPADLALATAYEVVVNPPAVEDSGLPEPVGDFLARLRLLEGVPFAYLVADDELLPPESIRFFYLDRNWTDASVDGAIGAGTVTTAERAMLQSQYAAVRDAIDRAERNIWATRAGSDGHDGPAEVGTGFLLRSRAVSGWPGVHVRAYRPGSDQPMRMLRIERLAPAVLLALIDGIPDRVVIEEPRQGIQFGVDDDGDGTFSATLRDPSDGSATGDPVSVPFRKSSPGVIDMAALRRKLVATNQVGTHLDAAEYALQMLQLPYQQWFGAADPDATFPRFLHTQIAVEEIQTWVVTEP